MSLNESVTEPSRTPEPDLDLPHARDLVSSSDSLSEQVVVRTHEDVVAEQTNLIKEAVRERQTNQTSFSVELTEPLTSEVSTLLSNRGYNYSTLSSVKDVNGERTESHTVNFSAEPLSDTTSVSVLRGDDLRWSRDPFFTLPLWRLNHRLGSW